MHHGINIVVLACAHCAAPTSACLISSPRTNSANERVRKCALARLLRVPLARVRDALSMLQGPPGRLQSDKMSTHLVNKMAATHCSYF